MECGRLYRLDLYVVVEVRLPTEFGKSVGTAIAEVGEILPDPHPWIDHLLT